MEKEISIIRNKYKKKIEKLIENQANLEDEVIEKKTKKLKNKIE